MFGCCCGETKESDLQKISKPITDLKKNDNQPTTISTTGTITQPSVNSNISDNLNQLTNPRTQIKI